MTEEEGLTPSLPETKICDDYIYALLVHENWVIFGTYGKGVLGLSLHDPLSIKTIVSNFDDFGGSICLQESELYCRTKFGKVKKFSLHLQPDLQTIDFDTEGTTIMMGTELQLYSLAVGKFQASRVYQKFCYPTLKYRTKNSKCSTSCSWKISRGCFL